MLVGKESWDRKLQEGAHGTVDWVVDPEGRSAVEVEDWVGREAIPLVDQG